MKVAAGKLWSLSKVLVESARSSARALTYTPESAIVFLTYRCTSRCSTCNIWQRPEEPARELSWSDWHPILDKMARSSVRAIELFGGDALLRKELLFEMIRFCREHKVATFFPTNSIGLTDTTIQSLVEAGLTTLYLSLDEVPEIEGQVRGVTRHFERVQGAIERVKRFRGTGTFPRIECVTTVSAANFRYLEKLLEFSSRQGVEAHHLRGLTEFREATLDASVINGVRPEPYFTSSNDESHQFSAVDSKELEEILDRIRRSHERYAPMQLVTETLDNLDAQHLQELRYLDHRCQFATNHMVVSPYGEVLPCLYYNKYVLGNLADDDIGDIWGNQLHREFCSAQRSGGLPMCDYCSIKSVHLPFGPTLKRHVGRVVGKLLSVGRA